MKVQRTGPDSILLVLNTDEVQGEYDLRRRALEALEQEGISAGDDPELTAYSAGGKTVVFVRAAAQVYTDTYFGFDSTEDLLDAACEAERLFPDASARLCRIDGRYYLATSCGGPGELLREYAGDMIEAEDLCEDCEVLIAQGAFQVLSGRC